jgi:hypothetical protein
LFSVAAATGYWGADATAASREHLKETAKISARIPVTRLSLLSGLSGICAAARLHCVIDPDMVSQLKRLDALLVDRILCTGHDALPEDPPSYSFDVICGAAGTLRYLLSATPWTESTRRAVNILVDKLIRAVGLRDGQPEGLLIPAESIFEERLSRRYPYGYFDLGLAHGAPGVLGALAACVTAGVTHPRLTQTVEGLAQWIVEALVTEADGTGWPFGMPIGPRMNDEVAKKLPRAKDTWCYGTVGVVAVLEMVEAALPNAGLRPVIAQARADALARIAADDHPLLSPTVCHGLAGQLLFAVGSGSVGEATAEALVARLLEHCDAGWLFGVRDTRELDVRVDDPGLLTGAAGVALALIAWRIRDHRSWSYTLLLS